MEDIELQVGDNNSMFDINNNIMRTHVPHLCYAHTWLLFSDLVKIIPIIIPILLLTDTTVGSASSNTIDPDQTRPDQSHQTTIYISTLGFLQQTQKYR